MTWFNEIFFHLPWKNEFNSRVKLEVADGWKIDLTMDDCHMKSYDDGCTCEHECGYTEGGTALRRLTLEELKELHVATGLAIKYIENEEWK